MGKPSGPCPWFLAMLPDSQLEVFSAPFSYLYYPKISQLSAKRRPRQATLQTFLDLCPKLSSTLGIQSERDRMRMAHPVIHRLQDTPHVLLGHL